MARDAGRGDGASVTLSESAGVRYLHFGTEWVQGAMRLSDPYRLELEYQQQMMAPWLFAPQPALVVQLGLGAAALTKYCYRHLPESRICAVDIDPAVIQIARQWFALPPDDARLQVLLADAAVQLRRLRGQVDWLQVDLYDAAARGPVYDDAPFYRACRAALRPDGIAAFNLFGRSLQPSTEALAQAFGPRWLRLARSAAGNTVVLAFAPAAPAPAAQPGWSVDMLRQRAEAIESRHRLPAQDWLEGLRAASGRRIALPPGGRLAL